MKRITTIGIILVLTAFLVGMYYYPQMPAQMASHWNTQGNVDGTMSKFWGTFLFPIVMFVCLVLFLIIPSIDPLKKNIKKFRSYFDAFIGLFLLWFGYIYGLTLAWNLGYTFNMTTMMLPSLGVLFFYIGVMLNHAQRNWFIGIRTPWTLSDDVVWKKTHVLGAYLFKAAGILAFLGTLFQAYAIYFVLVPAIGAAVITLVYSYIEYQRRHK